MNRVEIFISVLCVIALLIGGVNNNYKLCGKPIYMTNDYCENYQKGKQQ